MWYPYKILMEYIIRKSLGGLWQNLSVLRTDIYGQTENTSGAILFYGTFDEYQSKVEGIIHE